MVEKMRKKRSRKKERGSVMMEYLILNLLVFAVLAGGGHFLLPGKSGHGICGNAFAAHYEMVLDLISMPYP
ncbi:MAG: hypothetical protein J6S54_12390 [Lentisphaeria bacterium]|nr:hypothetical protein [Lentisphaeria bacterium]